MSKVDSAIRSWFLKWRRPKKHYSMRENYYQDSGSIIDVFAGGSVGAKEKGSVKLERHTFSIIDIYARLSDTKIRQYKFIYNNAKLEVTQKQIPPEQTSGIFIMICDILALEKDKYNEVLSILEKDNSTLMA